MRIQNALSMLLALLVVFNTSCACASMSVLENPDNGSHAHHQQAEDVLPSADCPHQDCDDCKAAIRGLPSKDGVQPNDYKFGLDDLHWLTIDFAPIVRAVVAATGPPPGPSPYAGSTPPRRFDLQLE